MPKLSVIIPAYNASGYIKQALKSVLDQDFKDIEIIIVDDGSNDNLKEAIGRYLEDKRVKYFRTENKGVSHAINYGLSQARGDYVCFLHADDIFLPGKIATQIDLMERCPRFGVSYTNESYFFEGTSKIVPSPYSHFTGDIFYFLKRNNFIHMSTVMFRKLILENLKLDEGLTCHEDWDLFLKLSLKGTRFLYIDKILSRITIHPKNLTANRRVMDETRAIVGKRAKAMWKEFKKGINLWSMRGILNIERYLVFKIYAAIMGFPYRKRFNVTSPFDIKL